MPLSVVESKFFRSFVEKLDPKYQMPSRKHLSTKLIHEKSEEVKTMVKERLAKAGSVCLTVDLWSNRQMKGFLGITGHYISISDWVLNSVMICCKRFKDKHSAENIRHEYGETVTAFNISDKITCIVSDNASNMIKSFLLPGYEAVEIRNRRKMTRVTLKRTLMTKKQMSYT